MNNPLFEMAKALAVAQASPGTPLDPAKIEAFESRTFRRRIAGFAWLPGVAVVLTVGGWSGSAAVGIAAFVILLLALFLYAERGDRIAAWIRRRKGQG
jgi:hypothetical protein